MSLRLGKHRISRLKGNVKVDNLSFVIIKFRYSFDFFDRIERNFFVIRIKVARLCFFMRD